MIKLPSEKAAPAFVVPTDAASYERLVTEDRVVFDCKRGLVADTEAPSGARVRAATALMDRAGLTPAYAVEVRHQTDHAQQQATEAFRDPQDLARDILRALPEVVGCLPREEVEGVLRERPEMGSATLT